VTQGALSGIRVLDLGRLLAAPWAAQIMGDLGADVIKIERPNGGDLSRGNGPSFLINAAGDPTNDSSLFLSGNRNKRSITVDLSTSEGQEIIRGLAAKSDVLIENFIPGSLAKFGLDYESLRMVAPRLIYCSVTGYGQDGPGAVRPGYDSILQAYCGVMSVTGVPDGEPGAGPMKIGPSTIDVSTGAHAAAGILAALLHRELHSGQGQHLDISLLNTAIAAQTHFMTDYLISGRVPRRAGNGRGPTGRVYACLDGDIVVSAGKDSEFRDLCEILSAPELATDERFETGIARGQNSATLVGLLEPLFAQQKKGYIAQGLQRARIAGAVVHDYDEVFADEQVRHQGARVDMAHPSSASGSYASVANPIRMSDSPASYDRHPPTLSEHTNEVLREILEYDDQRLELLKSQRII